MALANTIEKSINNTEYQVESYLGKNGNIDTYIVNNKNDGRKYICKTRISSAPADLYEKELYGYLSKQRNLTKFINPLQSQIIDSSTNMTHSFYPIMNGISLAGITPYLRQLEPDEQTILSRVIIKNLLEEIGRAHV